MSKEFYFVDGLQNLLQKSPKELLLLWKTKGQKRVFDIKFKLRLGLKSP